MDKVMKESQERRKERLALAKCVAEKVEKDPKHYTRKVKHPKAVKEE
jgi:hypothetical protein